MSRSDNEVNKDIHDSGWTDIEDVHSDSASSNSKLPYAFTTGINQKMHYLWLIIHLCMNLIVVIPF